MTKHSTGTSSLSAKLDYWVAKAAKHKLLGEEQIHRWEYDTCLANVALFQRLIARRQAHRFLITKANP